MPRACPRVLGKFWSGQACWRDSPGGTPILGPTNRWLNRQAGRDSGTFANNRNSGLTAITGLQGTPEDVFEAINSLFSRQPVVRTRKAEVIGPFVRDLSKVGSTLW